MTTSRAVRSVLLPEELPCGCSPNEGVELTWCECRRLWRVDFVEDREGPEFKGGDDVLVGDGPYSGYVGVVTETLPPDPAPDEAWRYAVTIASSGEHMKLTFSEDNLKSIDTRKTPMFKFKKGDRVRDRHLDRLGVVSCVYERRYDPIRPVVYGVRLDETEDDEERFERYDESDLEAVEDPRGKPPAFKFKKGDHVRVRDEGNRCPGGGHTGVIDGVHEGVNGRHRYAVLLDDETPTNGRRFSYGESELEAVGDAGDPTFKFMKGDRIRVNDGHEKSAVRFGIVEEAHSPIAMSGYVPTYDVRLDETEDAAEGVTRYSEHDLEAVEAVRDPEPKFQKQDKVRIRRGTNSGSVRTIYTVYPGLPGKPPIYDAFLDDDTWAGEVEVYAENELEAMEDLKFETGDLVQVRMEASEEHRGQYAVVKSAHTRGSGVQTYKVNMTRTATTVTFDEALLESAEDDLEPIKKSRFKTGDRVRVKNDADTYFRGSAGVITGPFKDPDGKREYSVLLDTRQHLLPLGFAEDEIEHVPEGE